MPDDSLREYRGAFPERPYRGRGRPPGYPSDYATQETPKAAIAAMISRMDRSVGRILALLKELALDDDTILFFTSDNGPSYGPGDPAFFDASGGLRGLKASLYEGGLRVPMIVRWPGRIAPGSVNDHPWYFADVMPTLAELARIQPPDGIDGVSVVPTLLGETAAGRQQRQHEFMYWENSKSRAVRMGRWKAIQRGKTTSKLVLYDLLTDAAEAQGVAAKHSDIVAKIKAYLKTAHTPPRPQIEPTKPTGRQFQ